MRYIAFLISSLVGFVIGHYLLPGAAGAFVSVIVSYHLYMAYFVVTAEKKAGISLPIGQTTITHLAFLMVVVGLPYLRQHIPYFSIAQLLIPGLAPFEAGLLFGKEKDSMREEQNQESALSIPAEQLMNSATSEDYDAFLQYMRHPHRSFQKNGRALREEYALWLADRASKKPVAASRTALVD
jgi:hypothetical protein